MNGRVNGSYEDYVMATGGTAPYKWSIVSGKKPAGTSLTYSSSTSHKLYLTGKPTKADSYTFTVKVRDKNGRTTTKKLTLTIRASNGSLPQTSGNYIPSNITLSVSSSDIISSGTEREEGTFTLPAELVEDGIRVQAMNEDITTNEININAD